MDVREKSSNGKMLIDVDEAIINFGFEWDDIPPTREEFVRFLKKQSIIDAVPVVRCRECKYWGDEYGKLQRSDGVLFARCKVHNYLLDGRHTGWCPTENDFCSYGERKEGADNG